MVLSNAYRQDSRPARRRRQAHRPGEPSALAHEPPPARRRDAARRRPGRGRHAQPGRRRADGQDAAGAGSLRPHLQRGRAGRSVARHARPAPAHAPQPLSLLETQPSSTAVGGVRSAGHAVAVPGAGGQHVRPAGARAAERAVPARTEQGVRRAAAARGGATTPPAWTELIGWPWADRRATRNGGRPSTSWRRRRNCCAIGCAARLPVGVPPDAPADADPAAAAALADFCLAMLNRNEFLYVP